MCIRDRTVAVLSRADYRDSLVDAHRGNALGGNKLEDKREHCGAYNFKEERDGATEHFNMCCQNRVVRSLQANPHESIKHCAPPPPELLDILEGRSIDMRKARELLKKYNDAFSSVSYGADAFKHRG